MDILKLFPRNFRPILNDMLESGWRTKKAKKGVIFLAPNGIGAITVHKTPSDRRAAANFRAEVRRLSAACATC